ncbi:helix-turn-helix domain-containing protein [Tsukamurella spumae]|uniref:Helix-turn-helix domain-containing protein n=1 Tax=Tsukamurella spumae TaxID=44753 RepID=A0A846X5Z0_9ACTN|nr:helix-turn-helix domain-containing protein [Tsukamurella spumae]NKY20864.1 helix-turn-helix domain-containing protein [Tsukamurella spumae]
MTEWLTVDEYAAVKRRSKWTVYRYLKAGLIPGAEQLVPGGRYRIPASAA